jgi:hypothetical protein
MLQANASSECYEHKGQNLSMSAGSEGNKQKRKTAFKEHMLMPYLIAQRGRISIDGLNARNLLQADQIKSIPDESMECACLPEPGKAEP